MEIKIATHTKHTHTHTHTNLAVINTSDLSSLSLSLPRLQFLPFSLTSLTNLAAVWIAENQNRPLLDMQLTRSGDGQKMLTCILLPQHPSDSPFSNGCESKAVQYTHSLSHTHTFTPSHTHTCTSIYIHCVHVHAYTHSLSHTHTHTHTHTHSHSKIRYVMYIIYLY